MKGRVSTVEYITMIMMMVMIMMITMIMSTMSMSTMIVETVRVKGKDPNHIDQQTQDRDDNSLVSLHFLWIDKPVQRLKDNGSRGIEQEQRVDQGRQRLSPRKAIGELERLLVLAHDDDEEGDGQDRAVKEHVHAVPQQAQGIGHPPHQQLDDREAHVDDHEIGNFAGSGRCHYCLQGKGQEGAEEKVEIGEIGLFGWLGGSRWYLEISRGNMDWIVSSTITMKQWSVVTVVTMTVVIMTVVIMMTVIMTMTMIMTTMITMHVAVIIIIIMIIAKIAITIKLFSPAAITTNTNTTTLLITSIMGLVAYSIEGSLTGKRIVHNIG